MRTETPASASIPSRFGGRRAAIAAVASVLLAAVAVGVWKMSHRKGATATAGPPQRSVLVVPFSAPVGDAPLDALAESLGAGVTRALANSIKVAQIAPPGVAAAYKGKPLDARTVGREAKDRYLVEGEVRAAGDDIGVTIRLADTVLARELASARQSVPRTRLEQETEHLVVRLAAATRDMYFNAENRRIAAAPTTATDAHSLVDRADAQDLGDDLATARAARKLYSEAIDKDPGLVPAWIGRANAPGAEHWFDFSVGRNEQVLRDLDRDSRRVIALDDRDARAWGTRARALTTEWQYEAALEAVDRAIAPDPTRFWLHGERAAALFFAGRPAEALKVIEARNALAGAPDSESLHTACHAHIRLGQYETAIAECKRSAAGDANYWVDVGMTVAYVQLGDMARAATAKARLMQPVPAFTIARFQEKFCERPQCADDERFRAICVEGLRKAGVPE